MRTAIVVASAVLLSAAFSAPAVAQTCAPGGALLKNDVLPDVIPGISVVSVVPGLCPGEAAGTVLTLPPGGGAQRIQSVALGFGASGGQSGLTATVSVEIYSGVTWSGITPTLGPKVFDSNAAIGPLQVASQGLNVVDLTPYDVVVGPTPADVVVAFRILSNANGSCAAGYSANPFTDAAFSFNCTGQVRKNLMDVQGTGWIDPTTASLGGFPLCPFFYNGNWAIRACVAPAATCQADLGFAGPGNVTLAVCGDPLATGGLATFEVAGAPAFATLFLFGGLTAQPTFVPELGGTLVPLPALIVLGVPANAAGEFALGVPGGNGPLSFFMQAVAVDGAQPKGYAVSNAVRLDFLP